MFSPLRMASLTILALLPLSGACSNPNSGAVDSIEKITELPRGITPKEMQKRIGTIGVVQFRIADGDDHYMATALHLDHDDGKEKQWALYLCIFKNDRIDRITWFATSNSVYVPTSQIASHKRNDLWDVAREAVTARDLSSRQIRAEVQRGQGWRQGENWAPLALLMTPVMLPQLIGDSAERDRISRRYDSDRIKFNMTPAEVDRVLGAPWEIGSSPNGRETRLYGEHAGSTLIVVVFRDGRAIGTFSDRFVSTYSLVTGG